jgi:hypothetical protein
VSVVSEILQELWSMFVGDRRLTVLVLAVVAVSALVALITGAPRQIAPALLLLGALAVLTDSVVQAARNARR